MWPQSWIEAVMDVKAWRRGERRVARGRVGRIYKRTVDILKTRSAMPTSAHYDPAIPSNGPGQLGSFGFGDMTIEPTRVWKASEQRWYDVDEYRKKFGGN